MPARDLRTSAAVTHVLTPAAYTSNANSNSVDLSRYEGGCVFVVSNAAVATQNMTITVEESDDDSTFTSTSYTYTWTAGTLAASTQAIYVHPRDTGRYVRLALTGITGGGAFTGSVAAVQVGDTTDASGGQSFLIDTAS